MSEKKRLDVLLTERGLQESRQRAQAVIMSGEVFVNGQRVDKPGTAVAEDAQIEVRGGTLAYVSRGGHQLRVTARKQDPAHGNHQDCQYRQAVVQDVFQCFLLFACYIHIPYSLLPVYLPAQEIFFRPGQKS